MGPMFRRARSRLDYQKPRSNQTLAEGLREYYARNQNLYEADALNATKRDLFVNHDVSHVVFGCDTTRDDEIVIDAWTIFGCDIGIDYLRRPEVYRVFL